MNARPRVTTGAFTLEDAVRDIALPLTGSITTERIQTLSDVDVAKHRGSRLHRLASQPQ